MLSKSLEAYWEYDVKATFMEFPTPFLTQNELDLLQYIALCAQSRNLRTGTTANYEMVDIVLIFTEFFKGRKRCYKSTLQQFCLWMRFFMQNARLSLWERKIILLLFLQCKWFIKEDKVSLPEEQKDDFMYGERIKVMKNIAAKIRQNDPLKKRELLEMHPMLYKNLKDAYKEGISLLKLPQNVRALNAVMTATRISDEHEEFAMTGTHSGKTHRNSEGLIRGFTKNGGVKSVQPVYSEGENTLFHSHPSLSPISYNPTQDFYTQKIYHNGDIAHSYAANKNIFAINSEGDVFYTNPKLASTCLALYDGCDPDYGQIYLGNIREFMK